MNNRLILMLPPSVNHMYINGRIGHRLSRILSSSAKHWMKNAVESTRKWREFNGWETSYQKTVVYLWYYFPDYRRRDTHNTLKILMDALEEAGIYNDDKYALPRIMDYVVDKSNPRIELEFKIKENEDEYKKIKDMKDCLMVDENKNLIVSDNFKNLLKEGEIYNIEMIPNHEQNNYDLYLIRPNHTIYGLKENENAFK